MRAHRNLNAAAKNSVLRIHFDGANPPLKSPERNCCPEKRTTSSATIRKMATDIPSYEAVRYQGIYPGMDLLFYGASSDWNMTSRRAGSGPQSDRAEHAARASWKSIREEMWC